MLIVLIQQIINYTNKWFTCEIKKCSYSEITKLDIIFGVFHGYFLDTDTWSKS